MASRGATPVRSLAAGILRYVSELGWRVTNMLARPAEASIILFRETDRRPTPLFEIPITISSNWSRKTK